MDTSERFRLKEAFASQGRSGMNSIVGASARAAAMPPRGIRDPIAEVATLNARRIEEAVERQTERTVRARQEEPAHVNPRVTVTPLGRPMSQEANDILNPLSADDPAVLPRVDRSHGPWLIAEICTVCLEPPMGGEHLCDYIVVTCFMPRACTNMVWRFGKPTM